MTDSDAPYYVKKVYNMQRTIVLRMLYGSIVDDSVDYAYGNFVSDRFFGPVFVEKYFEVVSDKRKRQE